MQNKNQFIWLDGDFVPWEEAKVHVLTHTLHYGTGVYEGLRAYETEQGPAIFRLQEHTARLFRSAHIVGMSIPYTQTALNAVQQQLLQKNGLKSSYIRPMIFYGAEFLGLATERLSVHAMIATVEWGGDQARVLQSAGIKVLTSSLNRHPSSAFYKAKANGNYLNAILALQTAKRGGADDVLLLDHNGFIAEGSGANFFMLKSNVLYTPETTSALEGITRDTIINLANDLGLFVKEKNITREDAYTADEAFFTGTAVEIMPIGEIDGRVIGQGSLGTVTAQLQNFYHSIVRGKNAHYRSWLSLMNTQIEKTKVIG